MTEKIEKVLPITILVTSYNRKTLLKKCIELINERTFYPYRIIVVDNHSTDGSLGMLKEMKVQGKIFDFVFLNENIGQCKALNKGFEVNDDWENNKRRPSSDFIVTTNEDIYPPMLGQESCWLTQMVDIFERNSPEYGAISMRIQRTPRNDIDESKELIPTFKGCPSVYRIMKRSDIRKIGDNPFGRLLKWESNTMGESLKNQIRKKFAFATKIYADHAGFMLEKKGYGEDIETLTVAANKLNERFDKPYPETDPKTNVPFKINHRCDELEQYKREKHSESLEKHVGPEVTVLVLTYKRREGLNRILSSVREKSGNTPYDLLVMVDNDDTESYNYCIENGVKCILSSFHRDFVAQVNLGVSACETPYMVKFDDDQEVVEEDFLDKALTMYKEKFKNNNGIMLFNDGLCVGSVFTTGMFTKKFVYEMGGSLVHPKFKHFGGDRELVRLTKELGVYHYADTIKINHYHPDHRDSALVNEKDETYKISENKFWRYDQDLKHYRQRNVDTLSEKNYYDYL